MASISRDEAHAIIKDIMIDNGGIDDESRAQSAKDTLRALRSVRKKLAAATSLCITSHLL